MIMKKLCIALTLLAALLSCGGPGRKPAPAKGAFRPGAYLQAIAQTRDTALIGDQFRYGFILEKVPEGTVFALPDFSEGFADSVELLSPWSVDTLSSQPGSNTLDFSLVITSFEEGTFPLPPLSAVRRGVDGQLDTLRFEPLELRMFTIPIDTANFQIRDIKGQMSIPLAFKDIAPYLGGLALLLALAGGLWALLRSRRRRALAGKDEPPHLAALRKLDALRGEKFWEPAKQKLYYSGITEALREYISARFGVDAMESTSAEIMEDLKSAELGPELRTGLEQLFQTADFVKFAKAYASREENAAALPFAVRFVTETYQSQLQEQKEGADVL